MDDLPEMYSISSLDQMRAIADDLRIRIFDRLTRQAMTVTQLGDALGVAPAKAHYHVRELERVGLVKLVETREKSGILEKYYRAVARDIAVSPGLLRGLSPDDMASAIGQFLDFAARGGRPPCRCQCRSPPSPAPPADARRVGVCLRSAPDSVPRRAPAAAPPPSASATSCACRGTTPSAVWARLRWSSCPPLANGACAWSSD